MSADSVFAGPYCGLPRRMYEILNRLTAAFEVPFSVRCCQDGSWTESIAGDMPNDGQLFIAQSELMEILHCQGEKDAPLVMPLGNDRNLAVLPMGHEDQAVYAAVGIVKGQDPVLLEKLASSVLLTVEQKRELELQAVQLDRYTCQVTSDFEELSWLRKLVKRLEYSDATKKMANVASHVLPALSEVIKVEAVVMFGISESQQTVDRQSQVVGRSGSLSGVQDVSPTVCRYLRDRYGERASKQPVVVNRISQQEQFLEASGVHSFILVPVAKSGIQFAWLLAINKIVPIGTLSEVPHTAAIGVSECEFGTFEGGLMEAAAILLANHAHSSDLLQEKENLLVGSVRALINALDARDQHTCGHSERVGLIAKRLAEECGLLRHECERIYMAGLLHDIGKIGVPDQILLKSGSLTVEEFEKIKEHPAIGVSILQNLEQFVDVLPCVLHHHESFDGRGYPHQLAADQIPLSVRILSVADAFDAMTSTRPYREAVSVDKAASILRDDAGTQWDVNVVDAFFRCMDSILDICRKPDTRTHLLLRSEDVDPGASGSSLNDAIQVAVKMIRD